MSEFELKQFPDAVYFDTNILRSMNIYQNDPWFVEFVSFVKQEIEIEFYICDLIVSEYSYYLLNEIIKKNLSKFQNAYKSMSSYGIQLPDIEIGSLKLPAYKTFEKTVKDRLINRHFKIINNHSINSELLLNESVNKYPPFESGDKGFRDAVILETYADHAKNTFEKPRIIVVSSDGAVTRSIDRFKRQRVEVEFVKKDDLLQELRSKLDSEVSNIIQQREKKLYSFIVDHEENIFDFVRNNDIEITEWWLAPYLRKENFSGTIREILSIEPKKIEKIIEGVDGFRESVPDDKNPIDIWVEVEVKIIVEDFNIEDILGIKYGVVKPETMQESEPLLVERPMYNQPMIKQIEIYRAVMVEATMDKKSKLDFSFSNLKLERIRN
ncbi:MAG: DUF4935 domain-containing protein [FCB group bacterium]|nr:DUF4935 domain-containing protein [FCB group bacterium]